jgi:glycosyltransferase involved in cell wall biosynthesis
MSVEVETAVRACPGAWVRGFIEVIDDELDRADIVLCPLRWGGGVKVKVIEALRRACLLVSTSTGLQGIPEELRSAACCADDAARFADHVVRLCNDPQERQRRRSRIVANQDAAPTWEDSSIRTLGLWSRVSREADERGAGADPGVPHPTGGATT